MKRISLKNYGRLLLITTALTVMVSGAAFAALQSQQSVLKGNTIQTATANLQLSSDGTTFASSLNGYSFNSLIPGGPPSPTVGFPVYLKNAGSTNLAVKLTIPTALTNADNIDLTKVHLILTPFSGGVPQNIPLQDLITSATTGGVALTNSSASRLLPNQTAGFSMQVSMENDAFTGASASLSNIDFSFSALAVN